MQQVATIAKALSSACGAQPLNASATNDRAAPSSMDERLLDRLWLRMAEIYGPRWTSAYGVDQAAGAGATWAKGLSGITAEDVARGLESCLVASDPWPPTLPQFRALCLGIPTVHWVTAEIRTQPPHPFVRLVWGYLDSYQFARADTAAAGRMLQAAYERAREHRMRGGAYPPEPVAELAATPTEPKPRDPAVAERALEEIGRMVARPTVEVDVDMGELD